MPCIYKNQRFYRLSVWGLFILLLLWTSAENTSGSGLAAIRIYPASHLKPAAAGQFSVISYNIAGLPEIISSAVTDRPTSIAEIGRRLNVFDIVHVQEDFNYNNDLYQKGNKHAFRTTTKGIVPFGDGLNTLSKYPVSDIRRISWNDCTGADCLTPKGFTYSRVWVAANVCIDFYNVHANAYNESKACAARCKNIRQLSDYIKEHSKDRAVIVMGDLNGRYGYYFDNINLLNSENGLTDAWMSHKQNGQLPHASKTIPPANILTLTDTCETIDKILYRSNKDIELKTAEYQLEKLLFTNLKGLPLSDHHPVSAKFLWNLRTDLIAVGI